MQILTKKVEFAVGQSVTDIGGNGLCAFVLYIVYYPFADKTALTTWFSLILLLVITCIISMNL